MRATWVSTTTPEAIPKAVPSTTLAVFRPTPGSSTRTSSSWGTWPPCCSTRTRQQPWMLLALLRKKPVLWMSRFELRERRLGVVGGRAVLLEQVLGDQVHPLVGTLGREDRGHQKLQRVAEIERALGVGIFAAELRRRPGRTTLGFLRYDHPGARTARCWRGAADHSAKFGILRWWRPVNCREVGRTVSSIGVSRARARPLLHRLAGVTVSLD